MNTTIGDNIFGMSSAAREVMRCLFLHGPTWDGKMKYLPLGLGELVSMGYARHAFGWAWLTDSGTELAINTMLLGKAKDRRQNKHREQA